MEAPFRLMYCLRDFATTEVEYVFTVARGILEDLQEIISTLWGRTNFFDSVQTPLKKLPVAMHEMVFDKKLNRSRTADELADRFRLSLALVNFYTAIAPFILEFGKLRNAIIHRGQQGGPILISERGYAIPVGGAGYNTMAGYTYDNSAVYLEGSQQIVTGNTFLASPNPLSQNAGTAIETHGGRSTISSNTSNNYATLVNVVPTKLAFAQVLSPNDIVVSSNSVTCAQNGISMTGLSSRTIQNVSITGNTIHVCNSDRFLQTPSPNFAGIRYDGTSQGDLDGLVVSNNVIAMQSEPNTGYSGYGQNNGGILLYTQGNLSNVLVTGNIVTNSPISGIRFGSAPPSTVQRVRVNDNIIVDAGNNSVIAETAYRHAIGLFGTATEIDMMRNMIYDTANGSAVNGLYSLYLNQTATPASANIRTSQNTVRVNSSSSLRAFQNPTGLVDATNANDVQILPINAGTPNLPAPFSVDFMTSTRYITTINGTTSPDRGWVRVAPPQSDTTYTQWTVGQLVTFRFSCQHAHGCTVTFDNAAYSTTADLVIGSNMGEAITFEVENWSGRRFFELYRTPDPGINN